MAGGGLFTGDAHACQGDGEVFGPALEFANALAFLTNPTVSFVRGTNLVLDFAQTLGVQFFGGNDTHKKARKRGLFYGCIWLLNLGSNQGPTD